ncbi:3-hydroxyacyl-CoA dehydrogenase [Jiella endophytica]|uniref:3-hydroxyacyl-CoA dehydrogenase n=1 Tax=Jiella endophytica TaxID=2558362 RepID=A0A4Y8RK73_9HYPH|nr:3-hydroxyacyl-CoA dehydrogenase NAD-binding domain-containing protein [Jiella endophytica]TFF23167.1 3-hydroxyacyl-CoA dehydrogenase [Jiella endophytica]
MTQSVQLLAEQPIERVAVIGSGLIGAGWAAAFLARGLDVVAIDPAAGARDRLVATIRSMWPALQELGQAAGEPELDRLRFAASPGPDLADIQLVQENAPEKLDVKRALFAEIERFVSPNAILASSTSALLIGDIQTACAHPERCVAGHPFNPPHLLPLVEVSGGPMTDPAVLDRVVAFYGSLGKSPVRLKKAVQGHIAGRLSAALYREAVHLVAEGVASAADIDAAVRDGPGRRWATVGPHMAYHLGGGEGGIRHYLDHLGDSQQRRWEDLGTPTLDRPLREKLIAETLDEAGGRSVDALNAERDRQLILLAKALSSTSGD